jgi:hypothetical protein
MTQTFVCPVGTSSRTSLIRPPSAKRSKYLFVTEMEAGSPVGGTRRVPIRHAAVQLRGRRPQESTDSQKPFSNILSNVSELANRCVATLVSLRWAAHGCPVPGPITRSPG